MDIFSKACKPDNFEPQNSKAQLYEYLRPSFKFY